MCLPTGMCVLMFVFLFYWGEVGLVLTNLNDSGWVLATDITTVRRESLPCPGSAGCTQCVQQSEESDGKPLHQVLMEAMGASVHANLRECVEVPGCVSVNVSGVGAARSRGRAAQNEAAALSPCWCCATWPLPAEGLGAEGHTMGRPLCGCLPCVRSQNVKSILNGETGEFSCYFQYMVVSKDVGNETRPH